jgi:hypothetical protein
MKGSISEFELGVLRARMHRGEKRTEIVDERARKSYGHPSRLNIGRFW